MASYKVFEWVVPGCPGRSAEIVVLIVVLIEVLIGRSICALWLRAKHLSYGEKVLVSKHQLFPIQLLQ